MSKGVKLLNNGNLNKALEVFLDLCEVEPEWAEPFNKVATIKFLQKDYLTSIKYIKLTLEKEKRHFGALSGQGLVQIKLKNYEKALSSYERVKKIYPSMRSPKIMIPQIKELIKDQSV